MIKLFLALFMSISVSGFSQSFVAIPEGLVDASDNTKNYVVIPFEGKSAEKLYTLTQNFRKKQYANPNRVVQADIENEFLSINTFAARFMRFSHMGVSMTIDVNFTVEFSFKNGRVKFQITGIDMKFTDKGMSSGEFPYISNGISWGVYTKKGKPTKDLPEQYQNYFNQYLSDYINFVNDYEKSKDDW